MPEFLSSTDISAINVATDSSDNQGGVPAAASTSGGDGDGGNSGATGNEFAQGRDEWIREQLNLKASEFTEVKKLQ